MTDTKFEEMTLGELRRLENGLEGAAKILHSQRPKGLTRAEAHAIFDKSRAEAVQAYEGGLDELLRELRNLPGPGYTVNLARNHAAVAALHVLASDQFAESAHARIDAAPLGEGITYENAEEKGAAIARNGDEINRKRRQAEKVGEIIKRREEEERERAETRRAQQIQEGQEETRRMLRRREEQERRLERLLAKEKP